MRKLFISVSLVVGIGLTIAQPVLADNVTQRIVPIECVVNQGQPTQSYLSEADCDALMNPEPPPPEVEPKPTSPERPVFPSSQLPVRSTLLLNDGSIILKLDRDVETAMPGRILLIDSSEISNDNNDSFLRCFLEFISLLLILAVTAGSLVLARRYSEHHLQK